MKAVKTAILSTVVIVLIALLGYCIMSSLEGLAPEPFTKEVAIHSSTLGETLFIRTKIWGATANHRITIVSQSSEELYEPDKNREYSYNELEPGFYRFANDTLWLYVLDPSPVPEQMSTRITVIQVELNGPEWHELNNEDRYFLKGVSKL